MPTKTLRTARLNRRRYLEIVKLLKEVVGDKKAGLARRMRAAEMLLGVYDRHDKALERKERKAEAMVTGAGVSGPAVETEEPAAPEEGTPAQKKETVEEFLARVTSKVGVKELGDDEDE